MRANVPSTNTSSTNVPSTNVPSQHIPSQHVPSQYCVCDCPAAPFLRRALSAGVELNIATPA
jgi:hypothetical protein